MHHAIQLTNTTSTTSFGTVSLQRVLWPCRRIVALALGLASIALSPTMRAVTPPPDGGYPAQNTAEGQAALFSLTTGDQNTAIGYHALSSNTDGSINTGVGSEALTGNTTGYQNSAVGWWALKSNTTGNLNTALGDSALETNTTGTDNTALGVAALAANTTGSDNIAIGSSVLGNTTGDENIAVGINAMIATNTGDENIAIGSFALNTNSTGSNNIAIGTSACGANNVGSSNVGIGYQALLGLGGRASKNIALGAQAGMSLGRGSNNICIGDVGVFEDENTTRIGNVRTANTYIAGISGATVAGGVGVIVDSSGHLGTVVSSERFKDAIHPMDKASEAILALQPVTFHYKHELDPAGIPQFGLVAEQVEKVNPDLVARDDQGKPYTVRYEAVNAMLLNEFLKEHRKVEEQTSINQQQQAMIAELQSHLQAITAILKEQALQIQKVSAQRAADNSAPRLALSE